MAVGASSLVLRIREIDPLRRRQRGQLVVGQLNRFLDPVQVLRIAAQLGVDLDPGQVDAEPGLEEADMAEPERMISRVRHSRRRPGAGKGSPRAAPSEPR